MTTLCGISFTPEFLVIFQLLWDTPVPLTLQCCGFWGGTCQRYRGQSKVYQTCQSKLPVAVLWLFGCPYICLFVVWCPCLFVFLPHVHMSVCCLSSICLFVCCLMLICLFVVSCPYVCLFVVSCLFLGNFYVVRYLFIKLNGFQKKSKQLIFVLLPRVVGIFKQFSECINYTSF